MIGSLFGIGALVFSLWFAGQNGSLELYFQVHSLALVGFGTLGVLFVTASPSTIWKTFLASLEIFKPEHQFSDHVENLKRLAKNKHAHLEEAGLLVSYAQSLWEQGTDAELFVVLLSEKKNELDTRGLDLIHNLKNLVKYPPALGMVGTVMGMINLFSVLEKNQERIGEALSVAMTATLFGLLISNFIISPLADRLHVRHLKDKKTLTALYEVLLLINASEPSVLIEEEVHGRAA